MIRAGFIVVLVLTATIAYEAYVVYLANSIVMPYCPPDPRECD